MQEAGNYAVKLDVVRNMTTFKTDSDSDEPRQGVDACVRVFTVVHNGPI